MKKSDWSENIEVGIESRIERISWSMLTLEDNICPKPLLFPKALRRTQDWLNDRETRFLQWSGIVVIF